ncbi:MAG: DUF4199 family protein [Flavobacteriales bacterium]|nr:DUF4199 family protein [Flavobacteriales bacterium]
MVLSAFFGESKHTIMQTHGSNISKMGIRIGFYTLFGFIGYFLLMKLLGLVQVPEFRYFNFVILLMGITIGYRKYQHENGKIPFLSGFGLGMMITVISVVLFSAFLFIYLSIFDPHLLVTIKAHAPVMVKESLTPSLASVAILFEGLSSGLIMNFVLIQYYKSTTVNDEYSL